MFKNSSSGGRPAPKRRRRIEKRRGTGSAQLRSFSVADGELRIAKVGTRFEYWPGTLLNNSDDEIHTNLKHQNPLRIYKKKIKLVKRQLGKIQHHTAWKGKKGRVNS
jgi:hypothetical protein